MKEKIIKKKKVEKEIKMAKKEMVRWMSQLTTNFGALTFLWSKFWSSVLKTR